MAAAPLRSTSTLIALSTTPTPPPTTKIGSMSPGTHFDALSQPRSPPELSYYLSLSARVKD
uniref:Uncharacterized protein n=1 Tax=Oryza brachyantha TaxID=4533 RepID=J3MCH2_ORYBR